MQQKSQFKMFSRSRVVLVIVFLVVLNIFIQPISLRFDVTQERIHTLSEPTVNILSSLNDPITIKAYFSDTNELPQSLLNVREDAYNLLDEYDTKGGKLVIVERQNPKNNEQIAKEASTFGIPEIQFSKQGHKELEIKTGYSGIAIVFHDESVPIAFVGDVSNLEYEITAAIHKLTRKKDPVVGILTDHGAGIDEDVIKQIRKQYGVRKLKFTEDGNIEDEFDALVILGPTETFSHKERFFIDQFAMSGGSILFFIDGTVINSNYFTASLNQTNINLLSSQYGVTINQDVVLDPVAHQTLIFKTEKVEIPIAYPAYPKIIRDGFNRDHIITKTLPSLVVPFTSSLSILELKKSEQTKIIPLIQTSQKSFSVSGNGTFLAPKLLKEYMPDKEQPQIIAIMVSGYIESSFVGEDLPVNDNDTKAFLPSTKNGSILVMANSRFLEAKNVLEWPENYVFFANALDHMLEEGALSDVRTRGLANRPIKSLEQGQESWIRLGNILASVIISVVVGFLSLAKRKKDATKAVKKYVA
jgi:gliding-associated putative ABC transporter substrate-binding component GldG